MNYYTIGLPRTRSTWLSVLLSYGDSYCFHEYLSTNSFLVKHLPKLENISNVGSSDTNPMTFNRYVIKDSPVVIINRPVNAVNFSLCNAFGFSDICINHLDDKLNDIIQMDLNSLVIDFDDMNDINIINSIVQHLNLNIPHHHIVKLMGAKITQPTSNDPLYRSVMMDRYKEL